MINREKIVEVSNDLLQNKCNPAIWSEMITEYCNEDLAKRKKGLDILKFPIEIQAQIIRGLVLYYGKKYNVNCLQKQETLMNVFINNQPQIQLTPIYYY